MRSRSSRLFIVLLHLVGVPTNLPLNSSFWNVGIVGVHPVAIVLDKLHLNGHIGGLDGLLRKLPNDIAESIMGDPYWLQDELDGKCLGPTGFSECGDATLWILRRRIPLASAAGETNRKGRRKRDQKKISEEVSDFAIQLLDTEMISSLSHSGGEQEMRRHFKRKRGDKNGSALECLVIEKPSRRNGKDKDENLIWNFEGEAHLLRLESCMKKEAWKWNVDGDGVISHQGQSWSQSSESDIGGFEMRGAAGYAINFQGIRSKGKNEVPHPLCIWRADTKAVVAASCQVGIKKDDSISHGENRVVPFSLIRYKMNANARSDSMASLSLDSTSILSALITSEEKTLDSQTNGISTKSSDASATSSDAITEENLQTPPRTMTSSESHSKYTMHPELKPISELLFSPIKPESNAASLSKNNNPLMLGNGINSNRVLPVTDNKLSNHQMPLAQRASLDIPQSAQQSMLSTSTNKQNLLHYSSSSASISLSSTHHHQHQIKTSVSAPRKIPVHPYIKESKNGVWTDPQTELEFLTDLSSYIGDDRKKHGRHTLMGVGQFTKTVFKIKVYGVALYVSKRDILADPNFIPFSSLNTEQIQENMDLFGYLQKAKKVDRTLLVKLNMQLGVDTIRGSLEADWKMLTDEHKSLLINCSMDPRPALKDMLDKITSDENSSRCSCAQIAPPEYNADTTCCARGTELAFTWRKDGSLEVRVDGRLMDTFSIPGLASGIFFEYLRKDDPISMDALHNFATGFPFLLAPLAQVKGASVGQNADSSSSSNNNNGNSANQSKFWLQGVLDNINDHANGVTSWMQANMDGAVSNLGKGAKFIKDVTQNAKDAAHNAGGVIDRKRTETVFQMRLASSNSIHFAVERIPVPQEWKDRLLKRFPRLNPLTVRYTKVGQGQSINGSDSGANTNTHGQWCHRNLLDGHYSCGVPPPQNGGSGRFFGSSFSAGFLSDEIGVIIHPNTNFTHKIFMYSVHLYLLLLLIVSLPESTNRYTRTRIGVKLKRGNGNKSISSCSSDDDDDDDVDYKKEFEKEGYRDEMGDAGTVDKENKRVRTIPQSRDSPKPTFKKSFSYFL